MIRCFCFYSLFLLFTVLFNFSPAVRGQELFEDPEGKYTVNLPAGWIGIINQDALGRKDVYIVFKVRENGSLKIRPAEGADATLEVMDFAKKDEEQTVRFQPGYDKISLENFTVGGGKKGALLSYDYKNNAGQLFTGRNYYLRTDDKTIYVLRFTGRKTTLGVLRNQTDAITRSFKVK